MHGSPEVGFEPNSGSHPTKKPPGIQVVFNFRKMTEFKHSKSDALDHCFPCSNTIDECHNFSANQFGNGKIQLGFKEGYYIVAFYPLFGIGNPKAG
jgi:hypothetical protein